MRRKVLVSLFLALCGALPSAHAQNYALVLAGPTTKTESEYHDFGHVFAASFLGLQSKGYQVTGMFGAGPGGEATDTENGTKKDSELYPKDYAYVEKLKSKGAAIQGATDDALEGYFKGLLAKVKAGDKVELYVSAHGTEDCPEAPPGGAIDYDHDLKSGCQHTISLFGKDGKRVDYPTAKLAKWVKKLEDAGALPNLIMSSCHSGKLKAAIAKEGLKSSCVYFAASGSSNSTHCGEDDGFEVHDYTSTAEAMALRYYDGIADQLAKDPYFNESKCFRKIIKHARENDPKIQLASIEDAFWSARRLDEAAQEPVLSTMLGTDYFVQGHLSTRLMRGIDSIECQKMLNGFGTLIQQAVAASRPLLQELKNDLIREVNVYNAMQASVRKLIDDYVAHPDDERKSARLDDAQDHIRVQAEKVIKAERLLMDEIHKSTPATGSAACRRPL